MNLRSVDLNLLVALDALLTERSVTRAARRLNLTQPAASQALRRARETFGDPLLVRRGAGMARTSRGEALHPELRAALGRVAALFGPPRFNPAQARRMFTVAASDLAQMLVLPELVAAATRLAPECRLRIVAPQTRYARDEEPDLMAMGAPPPEGAYLARDLFDDRFVMMARLGHPALAADLTAEAFAQFPQALVSPRSEGFDGPVDAALARIGLRRRVALVVNNFTTLAQFLARSDLVAAAPSRFVAQQAALSGCGARPLPFPCDGFTMRLVWPRARDDDPALRWLRGLV